MKGVHRQSIFVFPRSLAFAAAAMVSGAAAGSGEFYETQFDSPSDLGRWQITGATNWQVVKGNLVDTGLSEKQIVTVRTYDPAASDTIESDGLLEVHALIGDGDPEARIGVVFNFVDPDNYNELTISAAGDLRGRSYVGGVLHEAGRLIRLSAPGVNKWFNLGIRYGEVRSSMLADVHINGMRLDGWFEGLSNLPDGDVGLISYSRGARFDDFRVQSFGRLTDPYLEGFGHQDLRGWRPLQGRWIPQSFLDHGDFDATALIASPIVSQLALDAQPSRLYTFRTTAANRVDDVFPGDNVVGVAFIRDVNNYDEVVFSNTGQASLRSYVNGVRSIRATAPYAGGRPDDINGVPRFFEIEVGYRGDQRGAAQSYVKSNGHVVFEDLPFDLETGEIGLVSHFASASFDWVAAAPRFFRPFQANFNSGTLPSQFSPSKGSQWRVQNGQLNSFGIGQADFGLFNVWHDLANLDLRARITNHYAASGNRAGLVYRFHAPNDYYEVAFNPTGTAFLNRVLEGTTTTIARAPYTGGGPHQPFDVQLIQSTEGTTVKVNNVVVFLNVAPPAFDDEPGSRGLAGVKTSWTNATFDNVTISDAQL